ncbi:MAG: mechanosensitive ion channel family protein [Aquiluna sp.]|jgi:small-conductance mechanosensitive channel
MEFSEVLQQWSIPINILVVLIVAVVAKAILSAATRRVVRTVIGGVSKVQRADVDAVLAEQRLAARTKTIASVLDNFATWVITITAIVMVLSELGVNVGALIAVSTVVGAAIGFGAQTLVKDLISGLFIVFEDQYGVGDRVQLDGVTGVVERVGLRVTEVRDEDAVLWFIRNGEILKVGNFSQEKKRGKRKTK